MDVSEVSGANKTPYPELCRAHRGINPSPHYWIQMQIQHLAPSEAKLNLALHQRVEPTLPQTDRDTLFSSLSAL